MAASYNAGRGTNYSVRVSGLLTNGRIVYARLRSYLSGDCVWQLPISCRFALAPYSPLAHNAEWAETSGLGSSANFGIEALIKAAVNADHSESRHFPGDVIVRLIRRRLRYPLDLRTCLRTPGRTRY